MFFAAGFSNDGESARVLALLGNDLTHDLRLDADDRVIVRVDLRCGDV
jgi:hypothetical protein